MNFEPDPLGKCGVIKALKNALGIVVLNDELGKNRVIHLMVLVLTLCFCHPELERWRLEEPKMRSLAGVLIC